MICHTCNHFLPMGQSNPIAKRCAWRPSPEQLAILRAILPATSVSRALVQPTPHEVEACGAYTPIGDSP